jgi:hypothetical protein
MLDRTVILARRLAQVVDRNVGLEIDERLGCG